ncbi:hypothetical protein DL765_000732 [Monosporascus sp. GIB2]|nr:hypothetical protein DL765_000732 [Monosporascus sp. GIB2]
MADFNRQSPDPTSSSPKSQTDPNETSGKMSIENAKSPDDENGGAPATDPADGGSSADGPESQALKQVQEVLASEIGVATLLNRLKQSIASAKEFALFLKKRSVLEDDHAKGMKKLCRTTQDNIHHHDHRQGTFAQATDEMLAIHERMAENGVQFALSLHQMHEDLLEVAAVAEKHRKGWKQTGMDAENRLVALENAMRKSKAKYDSLAEEYDRVRTGESRQGAKVFGFKGPKSAAQHEEDLLRKVQAADTDYMGKVQAYQSEKATVESTTRPEAVRALEDLIRECDAGTTLQMQKFASFNEKLLLSNGLVISPLRNSAFAAQFTRSLKEVIHAVDNKKDFVNYITGCHSKVPLKTSEPKYERNPVLNPQHNMSTGQMNQMNQHQMHQQQAPPPTQPSQQGHPTSPLQPMPPAAPMVSWPGGLDTNLSPLNQHSPSQQLSGPPPLSGAQRTPSNIGHERSYSHGALLNQSTSQVQQPYNVRNSTQIAPTQSRFDGGMGGSINTQSGPPQLGALPFQMQSPRTEDPLQTNDPTPSMFPGQQLIEYPMRSVSPPSTVGPRNKQVFGIPLMRLYERDSLAVPMVVYQCIQAVDLYGLAVEGIYRLSGSATHVNKLKNLFDTDSESRILDFRNPENFFHDVNSVAGLLKQFLRDLPDPLLTGEHYADFIEAAKNDDDIVRRDSLHAIINGLPDPNYATLRALTLHLHRVMDNSAVNRMNSQNLAIVFGPTLMGTGAGSNIADAGWQVRVVDTILQNTYQIFDED